jgi:uncharacterized protein YyaL (SSP411 family)
VLRVKEDYDGAEPSGNSVAVMNLLRLARMTNRAGFRESAERTLAAFASRLAAGAGGDSADAGGLRVPARRAARDHPGRRRDSAEMRALLRDAAFPLRAHRWCCWWIPGDARALAAGIPLHRVHGPVEGRASAYVCRNYTCQLPVPSRLSSPS